MNLDRLPETTTPSPLLPLESGRQIRAERYFQQDLSNQRSWYSGRASRFKKRTEMLAIAVIAAGAASSFLQVFGHAPWVPIVTALLGALVVLAEGWRQTARYEETWNAYRIASEQMKRELRLYVNRAGQYRAITDEEDAFLHFVEAIEAILAEEQHIYWQKGGKEVSPASGHSSP